MAGDEETGRARRWIRMGVAIAAALVSLLYLLPLGLIHVGDGQSRRANDAMMHCRDGMAAAVRADRLYRTAGLSPFFTARARLSRVLLLDAMSDGLDSCRLEGRAVDPRFYDAPLRLMTRILKTVVRRPEADFGPRWDLEGLLHHLGRDRQILALAKVLPKDGDVIWRVTAALYLGEPKRAAAFWREPGAAFVGFSPADIVYKPAILCLAGDVRGGLKALDPSTWYRPDPNLPPLKLLDVRVACLRRGGRARALAYLAKTPLKVDPTWRLDVGIDSAIARGDLSRARTLSAKLMASPAPPAASLRDLWLQVKTGHLAAVATHPFAAWLRMHPLHYDATLYSVFGLPPLDEHELTDVAHALATSSDPALRKVGARAFLVEAAYLGRRWDPRFQATLDRARALDPSSPDPGYLEAAMAFFHGDWKTFDAAKPSPALAGLELARARLLGKAPIPTPWSPKAKPGRRPVRWINLLLDGLTPDDSHLTEVARLYRSGLKPAVQMLLLRREPQQSSFSAQVYRLTTLIRQGRLLHQDVKRWVAQLAALRKMYESQPDPDLLVGPMWRPPYRVERY